MNACNSQLTDEVTRGFGEAFPGLDLQLGLTVSQTGKDTVQSCCCCWCATLAAQCSFSCKTLRTALPRVQIRMQNAKITLMQHTFATEINKWIRVCWPEFHNSYLCRIMDLRRVKLKHIWPVLSLNCMLQLKFLDSVPHINRIWCFICVLQWWK